MAYHYDEDYDDLTFSRKMREVGAWEGPDVPTTGCDLYVEVYDQNGREIDPFKSEAQRRFLWAKHPEIARKWAHER